MLTFYKTGRIFKLNCSEEKAGTSLQGFVPNISFVLLKMLTVPGIQEAVNNFRASRMITQKITLNKTE